MKKERPASVIKLLTQLIKQTREFYQWTARQMAGAAPTSQSQPASDVEQAGKAQAMPPNAKESSAADEPVESPSRLVPQEPAPQAEKEQTTDSDGSAPRRDLKNRIDVAWNRVGGQNENGEEMQALLERAVGLLETVSAHPALRDYTATKRKLEEIEQRLRYGSYPQ